MVFLWLYLSKKTNNGSVEFYFECFVECMFHFHQYYYFDDRLYQMKMEESSPSTRSRIVIAVYLEH